MSELDQVLCKIETPETKKSAPVWKLVRDAGIKANDKLTQHCLRKSWACNLANAGTPIQTLMKLGGWSKPETCQKYYLKSSDENEKKVVRILDELAEDKDEVEIKSS